MRCAGFLAILFSCLIAQLAPSAAWPPREKDESDWRPVGWRDQTWPIDFDPVPPAPDDDTFYRSAAEPVQGAPETTAGGLVWRLETDRRTGIAYPRLAALPGGRPIATANRALDAVHGWLIRTARAHAQWLTIRNATRGLPQPPGGTRYEHQKVEVTYTSAAYLGVRESGLYVGATGDGRASLQAIRGLTFDLVRGTFFGLESCAGAIDSRTYPVGFTFGPLLNVCTWPDLIAFFEAWTRHYDLVLAEAGRARCGYVPAQFPAPGYFSLHLTGRGLAVVSLFDDGHLPPDDADDAYACRWPQFVFNPVVIPYRELAPLMRPGLLRDELLAKR